ncbi:hypothetical protein [Mycobacterium sp. URHB0044]|uniref:hypothetical protein n=1 Tax=Mycobacterium sp. URHB0044 TaxID=1380386 RepID=UPI00048C4497|nr:hypothetical protein [Mycobacterium sp. URHB0044]
MTDRTERSLTPSAQAALDSYIGDLRLEILDEAKAIAASISDYPEIGVSEVLAAIRSQQGKRERDRVRAGELKADRLRFLAASAGTIGGALIGTAVVVLSIRAAQAAGSPSTSLVAAMISAGVTLFVAAVSAYYFLGNRKRLHEAEKSSLRVQQRSIGELLAEWGDFTRSLDAFVARRFGESAAEKTLPDKVEMLLRAHVLTDKEVGLIADTYGLRNTLAHGREEDRPSEEVIMSAYADLRRLITRLARVDTAFDSTD